MTKKFNTVNIKGKEYVTVAERLLYLSENEVHEIITTPTFYPESQMWVVKAELILHREGGHFKFTGHAQEIIGDGYINKTSALENAETSAVGRACAMAGIGIIESIASVDEIHKAQARETYQPESDGRNWMSAKQLEQLIQRVVRGGEIDLIERARQTFKIRKEYNQQLDQLMKGVHPAQMMADVDPDAFEAALNQPEKL